jgi:hypothetical protein
MKLSITIEIDDAAPEIELCGKNCEYNKNGYCELFGKKLDEYSYKKIEDFDEKNIVYEKIPAFDAWKRYDLCIKLFYSPLFLKQMIKDETGDEKEPPLHFSKDCVCLDAM